MAAPAAAQERPLDRSGTLSLLIENDAALGSDRNYTNGLKLSWLSGEDVPTWIRKVGDILPFFGPSSRRRYGLSIGQSIFTPDDTARQDLIPNDRPYAAWLYGGIALLADTGTELDTYELNVGVIGPSAGGESVQNSFHRLIGSDRANGWDNQLDDEVGVVLFYEHKWRGLLETGAGGFGIDATPHVGVALGNVYTHGAAGLTLRFGQDLPADYGPPRVRPALAGTAYFTPRAGFGWYLFAGVEGRAVARDIFLDGNTFGDSHSVDKEHFVADLQAGIAVTISAVRIALTQIYRTPEFREQDRAHQFTALSLSYRW